MSGACARRGLLSMPERYGADQAHEYAREAGRRTWAHRERVGRTPCRRPGLDHARRGAEPDVARREIARGVDEDAHGAGEDRGATHG